jgi:hypothetical protein
MKSILELCLAIVALFGTALCIRPVHADEPAAPPDSPDQFVVTGKALNDLRLRIRRAEDDVYARFNEINSDDRFDIHCYSYVPIDSHIARRACVSNAWRAADVDIGQATLAQMRGESGPNPELFRGQQWVMQQKLNEEMRRLATEDPALRQELVRLGQAHQALDLVTGSGNTWTMYREVPAGDDGLPYDAQRMVDVRIGTVPWTSPLMHRTFTLAGVSGHVRNMSLACDHAARKTKKLAFEDGKEWTVPAAWGACTLTVAATRETTFRLVEFN